MQTADGMTKPDCAASKDHELEAKLATAMQLGDGRCPLRRAHRYALRLQQGARTCALRTLSAPSEQNLLLWAGSVRKAHCTRDPVSAPTPRLGADCSTLSYAHFRVGGPNRSCSDRLAAFWEVSPSAGKSIIQVCTSTVHRRVGLPPEREAAGRKPRHQIRNQCSRPHTKLRNVTMGISTCPPRS